MQVDQAYLCALFHKVHWEQIVERTLIIIKPDAIQRGLTGEILRRFEARGLRIIGMKFMQVSRELAEKHYAIHRERPFFNSLVDYITSAPVVVAALEGTNAVEAARNTIGATNPSKAAAGTIRGDLALEIGRNLVHGSDSVENGQIEVANFFEESELDTLQSGSGAWIFEYSRIRKGVPRERLSLLDAQKDVVVAPQTFEIVITPFFHSLDVDDDRTVVRQQPSAVRFAF